MVKIPALLIGAACALLNAGGLLAQTYDARNDFSGAANPNGVWSYGTLSATVGGSFSLLTVPLMDNDYTGQRGWDNGGSYPNSAAIQANFSGATAVYQTVVGPPDMVNMDGESSITAVRWTAPADGVYAVAGQFQRDDTQTNAGPVSVEVSVVQNGAASLFDKTGFTANGATAPFSLPAVAVHAGDTLDFVETPNVPHNDTTGLTASISYTGPLAASTVSIEATTPQAVASTDTPGVFTLTRTGDVSQQIKVAYSVKGTAQGGTDYYALKGLKKIKAGSSSAKIQVNPIVHQNAAAKTTVKLTVTGGDGYNLGEAVTAKVKIVPGSNIIILP